MSKARILCTEDDKDTREMLVLFLQDYGYEVVCSVDGKQTLDLVKREASISFFSTTGCLN